MKTLKSNLTLNGAGLMFAAPVEITIKPSDKKGIRFYINNAEIEAKVAEYKTTLEKEESERKAALIAKVISDIECINNIIAREESTTEVTVDVVTE